MASSMTGFGRATAARDGRELTIELKSVNHRYLDVSMRLPRNLMFLEDCIRTALSAAISRGHIDVFVNYKNTRTDTKTVVVDETLLTAYKEASDAAAKLLSKDNDLTVAALLRFPDVLSVAEREDDMDALKALALEATQEAARELSAMRQTEGERLATDILERACLISGFVDKIEARAPAVVDDYAKKLRVRIQELTGKNAPVDEDRLATEVAYFSDKSNITEEIVRLRSHIAQLDKMLNAAEPNGRKLDFLVQEMNREMNTIGSKASDSEIAAVVIDGKAEIEKIREQVQNIE